jgi:hypothetical protein
MLITNKIIKTINSAVLNRGLLQLINLLRKKLFFASTKKVKMRTLGAQRLVVMQQGNKATRSADVCLFFLFEFHLKRASSDLV